MIGAPNTVVQAPDPSAGAQLANPDGLVTSPIMALLLMPPETLTWKAWTPAMRWALMWQVEWLRAHGVRVTLVTNDDNLLAMWSPAAHRDPSGVDGSRPMGRLWAEMEGAVD